MSKKNALHQMHAGLNKSHKVSPRLSRKLHYHFWQKIRKIKVIKETYSHPNPNLKANLNRNANPKVKTRWFTLRLSLKLTMNLITCISGHKL